MFDLPANCSDGSLPLQDAHSLQLSVIVPVYNEEKTLYHLLESLHHELAPLLDFYCYEFIIINDGSTDTSALEINRFCIDYPAILIRIILMPQRLGSGTARRLGTQQARGHYIAWIDADGTYRASDLVRLYQLMGGADQIIGVRSCDHGSFASMRFIIKRGTARFVGWLFRSSIPDLNSGLRLFTRSSAEAWLMLIPSGFSCTTTATLGALHAHQHVLFVPIDYLPRSTHSPSKFRTIVDSLLLCRQVVRILFEKPVI